MKIGILSPEFPPAIGGVETYAYQYVSALRRLRPEWEITVFTRPHPEGEIEISGVRVLSDLRRRYRIDRRLAREYRMDVWHVMNAAYGWFAGEAERVVVSVYGNDFLRPYLPLCRPDFARYMPFMPEPAWLETWEQERSRRRLLRLLERTLPDARCVLACSSYTEQAFLKKFPACHGRTIPAMVGVDDAFFVPERVTRGVGEPMRLVTISRLSEPRKNIDLVLRSLARLKANFDFVYRVVGEGKDKERLQTLACELGIANRVEFMGRMPQPQMVGLLAASDLFILTSSILPYSHEGFGIVYLEANACGTPVLAARLGGAEEAVAEGESGMFVETPDVETLTDALGRFFSAEVAFSPDICRAHARGFTWTSVVEAALGCYTDS